MLVTLAAFDSGFSHAHSHSVQRVCAGLVTFLSLRASVPAIMRVDDAGDLRHVEAWLARQRHVRDGRDWMQALLRWLYFDSQIVRCSGDTVVGPARTLRNLQSMLEKSRAVGPG